MNGWMRDGMVWTEAVEGKGKCQRESTEKMLCYPILVIANTLCILAISSVWLRMYVLVDVTRLLHSSGRETN